MGALHKSELGCVQVVPESLRTSVYAFDRCFEGALGCARSALPSLPACMLAHMLLLLLLIITCTQLCRLIGSLAPMPLSVPSSSSFTQNACTDIIPAFISGPVLMHIVARTGCSGRCRHRWWA